MTWTTSEAIAAKARRRWDDGSLLRAHAAGEPFPVIEVPVNGPKPSEIGDDLGAVQEWVGRLESGSRREARYFLQWAVIGGRHIGRNRVPVRAVVATFDQAWSLLGVRDEVVRFDGLVALAHSEPTVREWMLANPHRALSLGDEWPAILAAYAWLTSHRGSGGYLREISAPGVDTKFVERHRTLLAGLLDVPGSQTGFLAGLGLAAKPELIRLRPSPALGLPPAFSELALRADELARLPLAPSTAVICENEITYLSVPVPADGLVLWGKGFDVDRAGRLPWLASAAVWYWGDLDTHGFAMLDRLRAWAPHVTSFLMDGETLLAHRERWVVEAAPTRARLQRLSPAEGALYEDLVTDRLGERVRLEQERIDWQWARARLAYV